MKIEIRHRYQEDCILYSCEAESLREAVERAIKEGKSLAYADMRGADMSDADMSGADMRDADMRGADMRGADMSGADMRGADMRDADMRGADMSGADMRDADMRGADMSGADMRGADMSGADMSGAKNLDKAKLDPIKADFYLILLKAINEVSYLRQALVDGRVNGSTYHGQCACLVGTIANAKHCTPNDLILSGIPMDPSRPAERWFMGILEGDTPETNTISMITLGWVDEFLAAIESVKSPVAA